MKTATLETSKKLQDAGIEIKTTFDWYDTRFGATASVRNYDESPWICPAPTFDEIWDMVPTSIMHQQCYAEKRVTPLRTGYYKDMKTLCSFANNNNIAEAAAQLLLWCKENGHLK